MLMRRTELSKSDGVLLPVEFDRSGRLANKIDGVILLWTNNAADEANWAKYILKSGMRAESQVSVATCNCPLSQASANIQVCN